VLKIHLFPIETRIRNASKGGKPDRKPYTTPMASKFHTKQSSNEENSKLCPETSRKLYFHEFHLCTRKTKLETIYCIKNRSMQFLHTYTL
jgi:hypothetical protein